MLRSLRLRYPPRQAIVDNSCECVISETFDENGCQKNADIFSISALLAQALRSGLQQNSV